MGTIKHFSGSGLSDLVVAAELIQYSSVDHAPKGKHCSRGMLLHKLTYKCFARKPLKSDLIKPYLSSELKSLCITKNEDITNMHEELINNADLRKSVASGLDHVKYWIYFMEKVEI